MSCLGFSEFSGDRGKIGAVSRVNPHFEIIIIYEYHVVDEIAPLRSEVMGYNLLFWPGRTCLVKAMSGVVMNICWDGLK